MFLRLRIEMTSRICQNVGSFDLKTALKKTQHAKEIPWKWNNLDKKLNYVVYFYKQSLMPYLKREIMPAIINFQKPAILFFLQRNAPERRK